MDTDNVKNNGDLLKRILSEEYPDRGKDYSKWLSHNVCFLQSELFRDEFAYSFSTVLRFLTPIGVRGEGFKGVTDGGRVYPILDPDLTIQWELYRAFQMDEVDIQRRVLRILSDPIL